MKIFYLYIALFIVLCISIYLSIKKIIKDKLLSISYSIVSIDSFEDGILKATINLVINNNTIYSIKLNDVVFNLYYKNYNLLKTDIGNITIKNKSNYSKNVLVIIDFKNIIKTIDSSFNISKIKDGIHYTVDLKYYFIKITKKGSKL